MTTTRGSSCLRRLALADTALVGRRAARTTAATRTQPRSRSQQPGERSQSHSWPQQYPFEPGRPNTVFPTFRSSLQTHPATADNRRGTPRGLQWPAERSPVAQLAEHSAVNRRVVGSSPSRELQDAHEQAKRRAPVSTAPFLVLVLGTPRSVGTLTGAALPGCHSAPAAPRPRREAAPGSRFRGPLVRQTGSLGLPAPRPPRNAAVRRPGAPAAPSRTAAADSSVRPT